MYGYNEMFIILIWIYLLSHIGLTNVLIMIFLTKFKFSTIFQMFFIHQNYPKMCKKLYIFAIN